MHVHTPDGFCTYPCGIQDDRGHWLEAKTWLISTLAGLPHVSAAARLACFAPFLTPQASSSAPAGVGAREAHGRAGTQAGQGLKPGGEEGAAGESGFQAAAAVLWQLLLLACEQIPKEVGWLA